jgi:hypothetical protein
LVLLGEKSSGIEDDFMLRSIKNGINDVDVCIIFLIYSSPCLWQVKVTRHGANMVSLSGLSIAIWCVIVILVGSGCGMAGWLQQVM